MQNNFTLAERVGLLERFFGISLVDYHRTGTGILFSSGGGIGLSLMDACPNLRWFRDVDDYRKRSDIDWESIGVYLSAAKPSVVVCAGWFSIDRPTTFEHLKAGLIGVPIVNYVGGESDLETCLAEISAKK